MKNHIVNPTEICNLESSESQMEKYASPSVRVIGIKVNRSILQASEPAELDNGGLL